MAKRKIAPTRATVVARARRDLVRERQRQQQREDRLLAQALRPRGANR